jgi:hypothetical protein
MALDHPDQGVGALTRASECLTVPVPDIVVVRAVRSIPCMSWLGLAWLTTGGEFLHQLPAQPECIDDVVMFAVGKREQLCAQVG